jgi:serine/threonine protein phosphatase PrpC
LQVEIAEVSLLGSRDENQDRLAVFADAEVAMVAAFDGMGGHADGAYAAEMARSVVLACLLQQSPPLLDPLAFLHLSMGQAHAEVAAFGALLPVEHRPRATAALCLVQQNTAWWAHAGDSRIYHLRNGQVINRSRDHSHVELLLQEGLIRPEQAHHHPMRNYVESCLGGEQLIPEMTISRCVRMRPGDTMLVCTDGFWANLRDEDIAASLYCGVALPTALYAIADFATRSAGAASDNTSAAALRVL